MTIHELDVVRLSVDLPQHNLQAGIEGTVVDVLGGGEEFTVEFFTSDGKTIDVVAVDPSQIDLVTSFEQNKIGSSR